MPKAVDCRWKKSLRPALLHITKDGRRTKENAMNAPEILLVMLLLRVVVPVSILLAIGENVRRHQLANLHHAEGG
jgi:hypothetical protein